MNQEDFRSSLEQLRINQFEFAQLTGLNPRTVKALGEHEEVPRIVELVIELLFTFTEKEVRELVKARELLDDEL